MADVAQCRAAASKGGRATSRRHGKAFKEARASKGGNACLLRYGRSFYQQIRAQAKKS